MEFSCYQLETVSIKYNFVFIKNKDNIIYMKICEEYKTYNLYSYLNITLSLDTLCTYKFYYIIYRLSLLNTKDIYSVIENTIGDRVNKWNILSLSKNKYYLNNKFIISYIFKENPYNLDFSLSTINNLNLLKKRQKNDSGIFTNIENIWLNEEINHMTNILEKIEIDIDKYNIYIVSLPYIKDKLSYKQDIIDCIYKNI
jgi:hypothetical protein